MAQNTVKLTKYVTGYQLTINDTPVLTDFTSTDKEGIIEEAQVYLLADSTTAGGYLSGDSTTNDLFINYLNDGTPKNFTGDSDRLNIFYEDHS